MNQSDDARNAEPVLRVMMMPRDTNPHGTIFGGVILSYLDQAGAAHARHLGCDRIVTVAMDSIEFKQPVYVGDVLSFYAETAHVGRTSVRIRLHAEAERFAQHDEKVHVTSAELVFVAVDENRKPTPIPRPKAESRKPRADN